MPPNKDRQPVVTATQTMSKTPSQSRYHSGRTESHLSLLLRHNTGFNKQLILPRGGIVSPSGQSRTGRRLRVTILSWEDRVEVHSQGVIRSFRLADITERAVGPKPSDTGAQ